MHIEPQIKTKKKDTHAWNKNERAHTYTFATHVHMYVNFFFS